MYTVEDALKRPEYFSTTDDRLFYTWGLGPSMHSGSGLLTKANFEAILSTFKDAGLYDIEVGSFRHYLVGNLDQIIYRVIDEDGKPTPEFALMQKIADAMEDYPVLDEMLYAQMDHEASLENIKEIGYSAVCDDPPEDWPSQVFSWLSENEEIECDSKDDSGAYPSRESVVRALRSLNLSATE